MSTRLFWTSLLGILFSSLFNCLQLFLLCRHPPSAINSITPDHMAIPKTMSRRKSTPKSNETQGKTSGHVAQEGSSQGQDFFPKSIRDEQESQALMKKLTAIGISTILYNRNMFPEADYGKRVQKNRTLNILDAKSQTPQAKEVIGAVRALFDPIEKKYLKQVILAFIDDPTATHEFLEAYVFKYTYGSSGDRSRVSCTLASRGDSSSTGGAETSTIGEWDVETAATQLVARIEEATRSLPRLKQTVYMTLRLKYTDGAPEEYEPRNFKAVPSEGFTLPIDTGTFDCGRVTTPFHSFECRIDAAFL